MRAAILAPSVLMLAACGNTRVSCCEGPAIYFGDGACYGNQLSCDIMQIEKVRDIYRVIADGARAQAFVPCDRAERAEENCREGVIARYRGAADRAEAELLRLRAQRGGH
jgi:hypothetical protein